MRTWMWTLILCAAVIGGAGSAVSAQPATAPSSISSSGTNADPKKQIDSLVQQGTDALAVGDAKVARDSFADAAQLDPKNSRAMHGLAIAYFNLGDFAKSGSAIDKVLAMPGAIDHAMAFNAGVIQIQNKAPMRAAKITREYLNAKPLPLDEPVANVLGLSLAKADAQAMKNTYYVDTKAFYDRYIKRLEAANPGFMRWGAQWLPADEAQAKLKTNAAAQMKVNDLNKSLADIDTDLNNAKTKLAFAESPAGRMQGGNGRHSLRDNIDRLEARKVDKTKDLNDAVAALLPMDPIPDTTSLLPMDAPVPPVMMPTTKPVVVVAVSDDPPKNATPDHLKVGRHPTDPSRPPTPGPINPGTKPDPIDKPAVVVPAPPAIPDPPQHRRVRLTTYAAAFPVANDLLITAAAAVDGAEDIKLQTRDGNVLTATVVRTDPSTGLALVRVKGLRMAFFDLSEPEAGKLECAAFPEVNIFNPVGELLPCTAPAPSAHWTIKFLKQPRLAGAPLIQNGRVVGVAMGSRDSDLNAFPALTVGAVKSLLGQDTPRNAGQNPDPVSVLMHLSATREREQ